jgi:hypothetical protein
VEVEILITTAKLRVIAFLVVCFLNLWTNQVTSN